MTPQYPATRIRSILVICGVISILVSRTVAPLEAWSVILLIVQLVALDMILKESTVFFTGYFRFISLCIGVLIIGALFKIMHWPGADQMVLISMSGIAVIYTIRVLHKKRLRFLDISKWAWLITGITSSLLSFLHQPYAQLAAYISMGMFFMMMLAFFIAPKEDNPVQESQETDTTNVPLDQL